MQVLVRHDWPGNVRELRNLIESMVVLAPGRVIEPEDIPREIRSPAEGPRLLPAPVPRGPERVGTGADEETRPALRPELEFVFRTLVELRMDVDQLRREFDLHRDEIERRIEAPPGRIALPAGGREIELRVRGDDEAAVLEVPVAPTSSDRSPESGD